MVNLEELKKRCLIFDLETFSRYPDGNPVDIRANFEDYMKYGKISWFGAYSYLHDEHYLFPMKGNEGRIMELLEEHDVLIGFNSLDFDGPLMKKHGLWPDEESGINYDTGLPYIKDKYFIEIDMMVTLGSSVFLTKGGQKYKNRGQLMGYKFKRNSLKEMAEVMGLETQKGDIDYSLFFKEEWTSEEEEDIKKYLKDDIDATKQMFEKTWEYWEPFTEFLDEKNIKNLSWIKSSIASLTYKAACHTLGVEESYGDEKSDKEEVGGRVIEPRVQEARTMYYCDVNSLYPHNYAQFNLFNEVEEKDITPDMKIWHGDELFKVEGYYDISEQHKMAEVVGERLKQRMYLKKHDPTNPKVYALKIFLNSLYGAQRSAIFENIHTPNGGGDCCRIGQTIHRYMEQRLDDMGFDVIMGDTDGVGAVPRYEKHDNDAYVEQCLKTISDEIKSHAPFPLETFGIGIDFKADVIAFPHSLEAVEDENGKNYKKGNRLVKKYKAKKKHYMYLITDKDGKQKLKIMGISLKKDDGSLLGKKILKDILEPLILKRQKILFDKKEIDHIMTEVLKKPGALDLLQVEYRVKNAKSYKNPNQIQAQISQAYFHGGPGVIGLVKNKKVGQVGKGMKYATVDELHDANVTVEDIDMKKLKNELYAFVEIPREQIDKKQKEFDKFIKEENNDNP